MSFITIFTFSGPVLGFLGFFMGWPWLFWVGVLLAAVNLFLNVASGVMKMPLLPILLSVGGALYWNPWLEGLGLGLLAWTLIEGIGELVPKLRRGS